MYTANSSLTHEKALCEWFRLSEPVQAEPGSGNICCRRAKFWLAESFYPNPGQRRFAELFLQKLIKWTVKFFWNELYRCRGNTLTMCEFHESTCNGFGDIWWTDNPIYFSSIDEHWIQFCMCIYFLFHMYSDKMKRCFIKLCCYLSWIDTISPAARGGNFAKIPPNQVIPHFGRGSSVEWESEWCPAGIIERFELFKMATL